MKHRTALPLLAATLLLATLTFIAPAWAAPAKTPWIGMYVPGAPTDMSCVRTVESQIGADVDVVNFFVADTEGFPTSRCQKVLDDASTPLVTLEFWSTGNGGLSTITNGSKDAYLRSFADGAKAMGREIWLRPFHEMNGGWYPWGDTGSNTPAQLIAAYRRVHDIFEARGATNVRFVWCPNVDFEARAYYPGDAYVDYAGIDGYNNGSSWRSFSSVFGATYSAVAAVSSKPIILPETSCVEGPGGKAAWITDMFEQIRTRYPRIAGVCWFNASQTYDWRLSSSASSLAAFRAAVADRDTQSELPLPRSGLYVQGSATNYIRIGWVNPQGGAAPSYLKAQNSMHSAVGPWSPGATLGPTTRVFTFTNLASKTTYWMRVLAINADGTSASSVVRWTTK
jgi:hypothetical protein